MATKSSDRVGLAASGTKARSPHGLEQQGLEPQGEISWNLGTAALYEHALAHGEGRLASEGAFVAVTAPHTGCSPNDKFLARDEVTESTVDWGNVNAAIDPPRSRRLRDDMIAHRNAQDRLFVRDARAGADDEYGIGVRVITPSAWQSLFAHKTCSCARTRRTWRARSRPSYCCARNEGGSGPSRHALRHRYRALLHGQHRRDLRDALSESHL